MKTLAITLSAVLLAACGGGGSAPADAGTAQPPAVPPPPGTAFFVTVQDLVRGTPDDTEPADVEGIALDDSAEGEAQALE
jgi:hypothetical protein